mgnify:CR=1 FL=1
MKQWLKDFTHNCIVHPMMMFLPRKWAHELHDKNANWAFGLDRYDELKLILFYVFTFYFVYDTIILI